MRWQPQPQIIGFRDYDLTSRVSKVRDLRELRLHVCREYQTFLQDALASLLFGGRAEGHSRPGSLRGSRGSSEFPDDASPDAPAPGRRFRGWGSGGRVQACRMWRAVCCGSAGLGQASLICLCTESSSGKHGSRHHERACCCACPCCGCYPLQLSQPTPCTPSQDSWSFCL